MALIPTTLANDIYTFFKTMSGISNSQFADRFSNIINDWYKNASGATIDGGTISQGLFVGKGSVDSIESNSSLCSNQIETTCNLIDNTKPSNAKELFAECLAKGIVDMVNDSKIKCKVSGKATTGTTVTDITDADSEGSIKLYITETTISVSDFKTSFEDYIKLPTNLNPSTIHIKYTYEDTEYISSDNGEGEIIGNYINGTVDYIKGDLNLTMSEDLETPIETISISYEYVTNFKNDVLDILTELEIQQNETELEWKTRLGGDADRYFANNLSTVIYSQITFAVLTTKGKGDILGSAGIGKLF